MWPKLLLGILGLAPRMIPALAEVGTLCISSQMEEFANFDFNMWRKRYIQWISHLKSRILDVFRSVDRDQDGRITQKEFIDYVLASSKTHML